MLLRLYNDDSPLLDSSKDRHLNKQNGDGTDQEDRKESLAADEGNAEDLAITGEPDSEVEDVKMEDGDNVLVDYEGQIT